MACQASARMARGLNGCEDWLHKGRTLMVGRKCMCFILYTVSSALSIKRCSKRHIRVCLRGGPPVARLRPLLFLPGWSEGLLRHWIQGDFGPGFLVLRKGVASSRVWVPSISPTLRRSGIRGSLRWFSYLLSRHRSGATGSSRRDQRLVRKCQIAWYDFWAYMKCSAKPSTAGLTRLPDETGALRKGTLSVSFISIVEPEVALQHNQAGHQTPDGLGGGFSGAYSQVCRAHWRCLIGERLGLEDLEHSHRV